MAQLKYILHALILLLAMHILNACSDKDSEVKEHSSSQLYSPSLQLVQNETLPHMMDKLMHVLSSSAFHTPISEEFFKTSAGAMISKELDALNQTLQQSYAYIQNFKSDMTCSINPYHLPWADTHAPFSNLSSTQKFEGIIKQTLALYLCQDTLQQDMSPTLQESEAGTLKTLSVLLSEFEKTAEAAGEREALAEFGIQVHLAALYGSYRFMATDQNIDKKTQEAMIAQLKGDLERDKGLLPQGHYEFYIATLGLLEEEIANIKPLFQRLFDELINYPHVLLGYDTELDSETSLRLSLAKEAFMLLQEGEMYDLRTQEIAKLAQANLNNASKNPQLQNYLYGLSYLTLALSGRDIELNLSLAQEMLQKDFKDTLIRSHRFDKALLQNSCNTLALNAYVLYAMGQNFERFEQLVSAFKNEYSPYERELGDDIRFYNDLYSKLRSFATQWKAPNTNEPNKSNELESSNETYDETSDETSGAKEEGYLKVPLLLSPYELGQIREIERKMLDSDPFSESRQSSEAAQVCLSPMEVEFMLSIAYQAYKAHGFRGVAPDMINIRLEELFGLDIEQEGQEGIIDYGRFFILSSNATKPNTQNISESSPPNATISESSPLESTPLQASNPLCEQGIIFDKDNGLILSSIAPTLLLEKGTKESISYRLKEADFYLNLFLFYNSETAAQTLLELPYKSEILEALLAFFPSFQTYLNNRLTPENVAKLLAKPTTP